MLAAAGHADRDSYTCSTAIGTAIMQEDDGGYVVTKLDRHGVIDWQVRIHGWSPAEVREVLLARALDQIGGAGEEVTT